ncbi:MAG: ammonium transporter [Candidatus Methanomethylophilaceae archaeon]|nr:ammonium transporter [Candidatus Methanomethylophilaceae archaeon]MDD4709056.1 ammonium transporter [Candidatus Methanomethylophilaceae archaeon]MDY0252630.1 ammonium transporter [Candidatus Methanomethylophilaceae archaeon]
MELKMERNQIAWVAFAILFAVAAGVLIYFDWKLSASVMGDYLATPMMAGATELEAISFNKNMDVWFMLMMVAFLMIFIRKFEWGTALAVLLSAAGSFIVYLFIQQFYFGYEVWDQMLMIRAVICSITIVIGIGVFLGLCKMWQYLLVGMLFAPAYALIEYFLANDFFGLGATDPGGSMLVHMCAAYFGIGVAIALREKRSWQEPMHTTTHSVTFVWLGSMILWVLWPSFVTSLLNPGDSTWGMITCYMAGIGSVISAYLVCVICQKKVNPLIYTYAMLAGPVAIGAPLLSVGPWGALFIGIVAGALSALCFIYLNPWFCKKIGVVDMMGVHNLHGMAGWLGALSVCVITLSIDNLVFAVIVFAIAVGTGAIVGLVVRLTRGSMEVLADDNTDFSRNEAPPS